MIPRKHKLCKCGCGRSGPIWSKGMLQSCFRKHYPTKRIQKVSKKQREKIGTNKQYYLWAIGQNIVKNKGVCRCDECGTEIKHSRGRNVAHIVSAGANAALYLEPENHHVLCLSCVDWEEAGDRTTMKLYQQREAIRVKLNQKYYING